MHKSTMIMATSAFFAFTLAGAAVSAQETAPVPPTTSGSSSGTQHHSAHKHSAAESNPACQRIIEECKKLGFIAGQWKKDNGLWKDCFDPVVKGGTPTRDGKPVTVPVSPQEVQDCQAAHQGHHKKAKVSK